MAKTRSAVKIRPVFDARTLRAVVLLCCGLAARPSRKLDKASYRAALDDVMNRCLAHLPFAKGATPEERKLPVDR